MKAIRYHEFGGPEVLALDEVATPQPGPGQVLVKVVAAGVNPADWKMRKGLFGQMPLPITPGLEGAGVVEAIGGGVSEFQPGDEVFGILAGSYAGYALAGVGDIQLKPTNLSFEQAASVSVGALTAWAAVEAANLEAGQRVLVHGAAGGVGLYVVQLAKLKGAHVIGSASAGNLDYVRSLGVETVLDYTAAPFETQVSGLDAVIDTVGGDLAERSFKVLRPGGVFVTVAGRLAPEAGQAEGVQAKAAGRAPHQYLTQITALLKSGELVPAAGKVFPLTDVRQAHELSATGHGRGRILLKIG